MKSLYRREGESRRVAKSFEGVEDQAIQASKDDADINVLVRRFGIGALVQPVSGRFGTMDYGLSFHDALNFVKESQAEFNSLPAAVRERFGNDPGKLLAAIRDPRRRAELEELGVVVKAVAPPSKEEEAEPPK